MKFIRNIKMKFLFYIAFDIPGVSLIFILLFAINTISYISKTSEDTYKK